MLLPCKKLATIVANWDTCHSIVPRMIIVAVAVAKVQLISLILKIVVMGYFIMQLVQIIPLNLRKQLSTKLWCKRLKTRTNTLANNNLKRRID